MGKTYALMFEVLDGGISNPIPWGKENLTSDRIIMTLDEENLTVWLWHGKMRGLVSRRTALRQAESLKGHGYTVGKSIIGRGMDKIVEIEERKIGRVPETTELNDKFMELLSKKTHEVGNCIVAFGEANGNDELVGAEAAKVRKPAAPAPKPEPKVVPKPKPKVVPKPEPKPAPKPESKLEPKPVKTEEPKVEASEYEDVEVPAPTEAPKPSVASLDDQIKMGMVIMAVLSQFTDIWASKKKDGSISVEQMDGVVCKFHIDEGKIKFKPGSFENIDPAKKKKIQDRFYELLEKL